MGEKGIILKSLKVWSAVPPALLLLGERQTHFLPDEGIGARQPKQSRGEKIVVLDRFMKGGNHEESV